MQKLIFQYRSLTPSQSDSHTDQEDSTFRKRPKSTQDQITTVTSKAACCPEEAGPPSDPPADLTAGPKGPLQPGKMGLGRTGAAETLTLLERSIESQLKTELHQNVVKL